MFTDVGSRHYRRGVVLGLSLAELFTVLVFLLLLVLGGYSFVVNDEIARKDALLADQRDVLTTLVSIEPASIEPAFPEELVRVDNAEAMRTLGAENRRLRDRLARKEEIEKSNSMDSQVLEESKPNEERQLSETVPRDEYERQQTAIDSLSSHAAKLQRTIEEIGDPEQQDQVRKLRRELENLRERNREILKRVNAPPDLKKAIEEAHELRETVAALREENETLAQERDAIADQKGQDSPCWYRIATRTNGESYERALYIFDIRIDDRSIFVKDIEAPTPQYATQRTGLRFDRNSLDRNLTDDEFIRAFSSLKDDADNRQVRSDRRCTFYVAVWDATSATSKTRYKRAHNKVVQAIFNTFEYQDKAWPH